MKAPFKPGDRVRVYSGSDVFLGTVEFVNVGFETLRLVGGTVSYSPKQCRRLKPKKRTEFFLAPNGRGCPYIRGMCVVGTHECHEKNGCIKVREIGAGKK